MTRYELSVSPDYVPHWTEVEAVRELFQNALDSTSEMEWNYNEEECILSIASPGITLDRRSLLFGATTKAQDSEKIGTFGEGYKLAFLTLARMGYTVKVFNGTKETWLPKIIKSKRYQGDLLVIDVEKTLIKSRVETLSIHIIDLSPEVFKSIANSNLHIKPATDMWDTELGSILLDTKQAGKIFVGGLFVCKSELKYGYNVKPEYLKTNRDRDLVNNFDLAWLTSRMWNKTDKISLVSMLINNEVPDVQYIVNQCSQSSDLQTTMALDFKAKFGKYAIPVSSQDQFDLVKQKYKRIKPIFAPNQTKELLYSYTNSVLSKAELYSKQGTPEELLKAFFKKHSRDMRPTSHKDFKEILEISKDWILR